MEPTEMGALKSDNKWSVGLQANLDVKIHRRLSRFITAKGSCTSLVTVGPTKE